MQNNLFNYILTGLLGVAIGFVIASDFHCGPKLPSIGKSLPRDPSIEVVTETDTVYQYRVIYRDRWRVDHVPAIVEYDTVSIPTVSRSYVARLDTVTGNSDTVSISFRHPERDFSFAIRPRPDTAHDRIVRETKIITIRDQRKFGLGFHAGPGVQIDKDGAVRVGVEIGFGINFNIWEP